MKILYALTMSAVISLATVSLAQPPNTSGPPVTVTYGDPVEVMRSSEAMIGALESTFDSARGQYIPGYGLQVNAAYSGVDIDSQAFLNTTTEVLIGLSSLVKGLGADDRVSVSYSLDDYSQAAYFTVRLVPGDPNSYEVFVNGTKQ